MQQLRVRLGVPSPFGLVSAPLPCTSGQRVCNTWFILPLRLVARMRETPPARQATQPGHHHPHPGERWLYTRSRWHQASACCCMRQFAPSCLLRCRQQDTVRRVQLHSIPQLQARTHKRSVRPPGARLGGPRPPAPGLALTTASRAALQSCAPLSQQSAKSSWPHS